MRYPDITPPQNYILCFPYYRRSDRLETVVLELYQPRKNLPAADAEIPRRSIKKRGRHKTAPLYRTGQPLPTGDFRQPGGDIREAADRFHAGILQRGEFLIRRALAA